MLDSKHTTDNNLNNEYQTVPPPVTRAVDQSANRQLSLCAQAVHVQPGHYIHLSAIETVATVTNSIAVTAATTIDAGAVDVASFTVATQTTISVLLQQPLPSPIVLSVQPLPLPRFALIYRRYRGQ